MNPFAALLDLIIPRVCHVCGDHLLPSESFVCSACAGKLPITGYERYWTNTSAPNSDLNPMEQRFAGQFPLGHACAPFFYSRDSSLASLIHDFKYRNFPRLATTLGALGARKLLPSGIFAGIDILLPVPLHWTKKMRRGYNQSEMIAKGVEEVTGIPMGNNLRARRPHRTQTSLSSARRIENTRGIFTVNGPSELEGKHIMLVDDICTTGATVLAAAEAITTSVSNIRISVFTLGVV